MLDSARRRVGTTAGFTPFPAEALERSIAARFAEVAARFPDRVAVVDPRVTLSYAELAARARALAAAIVARRGAGPENVGVLLAHDAEAVTAIMAVLLAGKTYVPLDVTYPHLRLVTMLADSRAGCLIDACGPSGPGRELAAGSLPVIPSSCDPPQDEPGCHERNAEALAYVIYTSGSTGQPKGVPHTHRSVLHEVMCYANAAAIGPADRLLLVSSLSFSDAVRTTFAALLSGASLWLHDVRRDGLARLASAIEDNGITVFRSVPTVFRAFMRELPGRRQLRSVRLVYLAGEPVRSGDVEAFRRHFRRGTVLVNGLGTAETLTFRWMFLDHDSEVGGNVPVGQAVPDTEVVLLDSEGREVSEGAIGEIAVRSRATFPGYWRRDDLTQAAFRDHPRGDGRLFLTGDLGRMMPGDTLIHEGRTDFQVKIRGSRVEVVEVEAALTAVPGVREAAVAAVPGPEGDQRLAAWVVPDRGSPPPVAALRRILADRLPAFMVPSVFVLLAELPRTPSGKLDRRSLPMPPSTRPELDRPFTPPRNPTEVAIAAIWSEVIGNGAVGVHDHFLDLGGDSLLATRIVSRVVAAFPVKVTPADLFRAPTVAQMAAALEDVRGRSAPD